MGGLCTTDGWIVTDGCTMTSSSRHTIPDETAACRLNEAVAVAVAAADAPGPMCGSSSRCEMAPPELAGPSH